MNLFQLGEFILHSGQRSRIKINCDALTDEDWKTLAFMLAERLPAYGNVYGIPSGGIKLANALKEHAVHQVQIDQFPRLIVDDVLTSGKSMEEWKAVMEAGDYSLKTPIIGAVVFSRTTKVPSWITPLFTIWPE